jgi:four helix bundle protein
MQIQERTLEFGVKILKFVDNLPKTVGGSVLAKQVIRSGTSIGANMEEADGASSKADFANKVTIARKEARETRYWLYLIKKADLIHDQRHLKELEVIIQESHEIVLILSAIIRNTKESKEGLIK